MATVKPFAALRYADRDAASDLIAPPYDVLDEAAKRRLLDRNPRNIVKIDLPHTPPKAVGPDAAYDRAAATLAEWLADGTLARDPRPALYPYAQKYDLNGQSFCRRGFLALVRLSPLGQDVIPHELTHAGPIEDRLKLMHATKTQLSPIFGLFDDPGAALTGRLYAAAGPPDVDAVLDGVRHHLWAAADPALHAEVAATLATKKIYVADGHHRYTTALQYQKDAEAAHGGPLPPDHPANFCLFALVAMQDPGLTILGYHRLIGGAKPFSPQDFRAAVAGVYEVEETDLRPYDPTLLNRPGTVGLYVGATGKTCRLRLCKESVLDDLTPEKSQEWRRLDTAIVKHYLMDQVLAPAFGGPLNVGYSADPAAVPTLVDGNEYQIALLLRPTPLSALEALGRVGEVMPQKSTYFAPKLATGLVLNSLE